MELHILDRTLTIQLILDISLNGSALDQSDCVNAGDFIPEVRNILWLRLMLLFVFFNVAETCCSFVVVFSKHFTTSFHDLAH